MAATKTPGFFMIVPRRECSSLWACWGSHDPVYYGAVVNKILASTPYMKMVIFSNLAEFVVFRSRVLSTQGPGVKRVSQT